MIAFGLKSTKFARVGQYIGAITQLVSNAATFTQAAISGLENAKAIFRNAKSGKLLSIDTASNVAALGLNLFTTIVSGKEAVTSGKNIKKMIGTDVGNKWGNKANNKPLLECNLQFFGDKNGGNTNVIKFPSNPEKFSPKGLTKIGPFETKNGKIIKWIDENKKAVFEWDEDLKYGSHYHIIGDDGNTRIANSSGETHFLPGDIYEK